jgi:hypothetical protein
VAKTPKLSSVERKIHSINDIDSFPFPNLASVELCAYFLIKSRLKAEKHHTLLQSPHVPSQPHCPSLLLYPSHLPLSPPGPNCSSHLAISITSENQLRPVITLHHTAFLRFHTVSASILNASLAHAYQKQGSATLAMVSISPPSPFWFLSILDSNICLTKQLSSDL